MPAIQPQPSRPPDPLTREMISVDPARIHVSMRLVDSLVAYGLGACVCVCLYDAKRKIGGLAHITLPRADSFKEIEPSTFNQPARFVDVAVPVLVDAMVKTGASVSNMRAAIVGGSHLARTPKSCGQMPDLVQAGVKTVAAAVEILDGLKIPIIGKDTGGSRGRTVVFRVCDGFVISKQSASDAQVIAMLNAPIESKAA